MSAGWESYHTWRVCGFFIGTNQLVWHSKVKTMPYQCDHGAVLCLIISSSGEIYGHVGKVVIKPELHKVGHMSRPMTIELRCWENGSSGHQTSKKTDYVKKHFVHILPTQFFPTFLHDNEMGEFGAAGTGPVCGKGFIWLILFHQAWIHGAGRGGIGPSWNLISYQ